MKCQRPPDDLDDAFFQLAMIVILTLVALALAFIVNEIVRTLLPYMYSYGG